MLTVSVLPGPTLKEGFSILNQSSASKNISYFAVLVPLFSIFKGTFTGL